MKHVLLSYLQSWQLAPGDAFKEEVQGSLAATSARGGMHTLVGQGASFFVTTLRTLILARLLRPADFGLIGMVAVLITFAELFKDAGLTTATVQRPRITQQDAGCMFCIHMLICAVITLLLWFCAPAVALFYRQPALLAVTRFLSLGFLIKGLSLQHYALLKRRMRYRELAFVQIVSQVAGFVAAVWSAFAGLGYWSLVAASLATAGTYSLLLFVLCPWVPHVVAFSRSAWEMVKFGGWLTGFNVINYFARNADNLLIGRFIGATSLGIYDRAYHILLLPIAMMSGPLSAVALPVLSRLHDNRTRMHRYYLHVIYMLALCASPMVGLLFVLADELVLVLLGRGWEAVAPTFRILAIGALFQPLYNTQAWLHVATGRADRVFRWGMIGTPLILVGFLIGLPWGIPGVATAYSVATIVVTIGSLCYAADSAGLAFRRIVQASILPLVATVVAAGVVMQLLSGQPPMSILVSLFAKGAGFVLVYAVALVLLYRGMKPFRDMIWMWNLIRYPNIQE